MYHANVHTVFCHLKCPLEDSVEDRLCSIFGISILKQICKYRISNVIDIVSQNRTYTQFTSRVFCLLT